MVQTEQSFRYLCSDSRRQVFFQLRQLRRVRRSLDRESAATQVPAFMASRIDYCNALLANAPRTTTDKLQRVLNAAARVITGTRKFDRGLTHFLHDKQHWLDVPQSVTSNSAWRCISACTAWHRSTSLRCASRGRRWSPPTPFCKPRTSILSSLQHVKLRSTRVCCNVRKSTSIAIFKRSLKTFLFEQITHSAH